MILNHTFTCFYTGQELKVHMCDKCVSVTCPHVSHHSIQEHNFTCQGYIEKRRIIYDFTTSLIG